MNILLVSSGDNGGGCWFLAQAINQYTEHTARAIRMMQSWIEYPYDILSPSQAEMEALCQWADVVHGRDTCHFLPDQSKPTVLTYTGVSYRKRSGQFHQYCRERKWIVSVSTPDMLSILRAAKLPELWMPQTRPDAIDRSVAKHPKFTVCHAPTMRNRKGTETVVEALAGLPEVSLELIEKTPYSECLERKRHCHALIDQFLAGYGNNAIEAWAMGLPVISGASMLEWTQNIRGLCGGQTPYLSATEDVKELQEIVERLRTDSVFYEEAAEKGRNFYLQYHQPEAAAQQAVKLYEMAQEAKGAKKSRRKVARKPTLKILSIGEWDYAACGYFLSQAINEITSHESRSVRWAKSTFSYPYDLMAPPEDEIRELWDWASVIHIHDSARSLLPGLPPKPTVITWHGTRYRQAPQKYNRTAAEQGWLPTVATLDLTFHGPRWLPDCRPDLSGYVSRPRGKFIICHAPTKRAVKGTEAIIKATRELDFTLIENTSWQKCLKLKGRASVTVDQFKLGYGCNAIEAWAMSQAVIGNGEPLVQRLILGEMGYFPFVQCEENADEIRETLTRLQRDKAFYTDAVRRGERCYNTFHAPAAVAKRAIAFYEEAMAKGPTVHLQEIPRRRKGRGGPVEIGAEGLTLIEYIGPNHLDMAWWGEVTGQKYQLGGVRKQGYVDSRDAPRLLTVTDKRGRLLFRKAK